MNVNYFNCIIKIITDLHKIIWTKKPLDKTISIMLEIIVFNCDECNITKQKKKKPFHIPNAKYDFL